MLQSTSQRIKIENSMEKLAKTAMLKKVASRRYNYQCNYILTAKSLTNKKIIGKLIQILCLSEKFHGNNFEMYQKSLDVVLNEEIHNFSPKLFSVIKIPRSKSFILFYFDN